MDRGMDQTLKKITNCIDMAEALLGTSDICFSRESFEGGGKTFKAGICAHGSEDDDEFVGEGDTMEDALEKLHYALLGKCKEKAEQLQSFGV